MSIKDEIINAITAHPKLVTYDIGLAITIAATGIMASISHDVFAANSTHTNNGGNAGPF